MPLGGSSKLFRAKYPGKCTECEHWFDDDEWIGYVDDELVCELCYEDLT